MIRTVTDLINDWGIFAIGSLLPAFLSLWTERRFTAWSWWMMEGIRLLSKQWTARIIPDYPTAPTAARTTTRWAFIVQHTTASAATAVRCSFGILICR